MTVTAKTAQAMISGMRPSLRPGTFAVVTLSDPASASGLAGDAIATFREDEGLSLILETGHASAAGLDTSAPMHCITLQVYSSLAGVGLTAAVASALAEAGIPCNMVAAFHHDHVFVPAEQSTRALSILLALQQSAAGENS